MPRDDFSSTTRERVAARAGHRCSICGIATSGPSAEGEDAVTRTGVAAHITAASPGGPRYDPSLSAAERSSITNALWTCAICGKRVDDDTSTFTVAELSQIKADAERRAAKAQVPSEFTRETEHFLALVKRARDAATTELRSRWQAKGSRSPVQLPLLRDTQGRQDRVQDRPNSELDVRDLATLLRSGASAFLRAPPGAGKTTTLLQVGSAALETTTDAIPLFVPLTEASRYADLLEAAARRLAFSSSGLDRNELARLATQGHVILLCDGWNEVGATERARLATELAELRAQAPDLGIAVAGRTSDPALPLRDPVVLHIGGLTEAQQDAIALELGGPSGEALLDHAKRTAGIAELLDNPFYLSALVTTYAGGDFPASKESVLRAFVAKVEAEKSAPLWARFRGTQEHYLQAIAVALQVARRVSLEEKDVLATLYKAGDTLVRSQVLRAAGEPGETLDALVDGHLLVRTLLANQSLVSFQHQLFQEWYASFFVERAMHHAARDPNDSRRFVGEFLNEPWWEEAVLFACERASGQQEMHPIVAHTIRSALPLDASFAATIVSRCGDGPWAAVHDEVAALVDRWLAAGEVDRAVEFIFASSRPDFAERIWRLLSSPDQQRRLGILRSDRLSLTVFGPSAKDRVLSASQELASELLQELSFVGGPREIEFAVDVAPRLAPAVVAVVAEALAFRGARAQLKRLLRNAPTAAWALIARTNHLDSILEGDDADRLSSTRNMLLADAPTPLERLRLRVLGAAHPDSPPIRSDVAQAEFPSNLYGFGYELLAALSKRFVEEVQQGLLDRLVAGRPIPASSEHLLSGAISNDQEVADRALAPETPWHVAEVLSSTLSEDHVASLVDAYIPAIPAADSTRGWERFDRLRTLLAAVPVGRLVNVLSGRAPAVSARAVGALAEALSRAGRDDRERRQAFDATLEEKALPMLRGWVDVALGDADASRSDLASVASAIGRTGWPDLTGALAELEKRDSERLQAEAEELKLALAKGQRPTMARVLYGRQYADAFIRLAGPAAAEALKSRLHDVDFGPDAARALRGIWEREAGVTRDSTSLLFGAAPERCAPPRARRELETHPYAVAIVDAANELGADATPRAVHRAFQLYSVAAWMPYGHLRSVLLDAVQRASSARDVLGILSGLADAGETLDSALLIQWCRTETRAICATRSFDREWWRVEDFLKLLPFSDDPTAILTVLADPDLEDVRIRPSSFHAVFAALRAATNECAGAVLVELARRLPAIAEDSAWLRAISDCASARAARELAVYAFEADSSANSAPRLDRSYFVSVLGALLGKHQDVAEYLVGCLANLSVPMRGSLVASALATVPDEKIILALLEHEARTSPEGHGSIPTTGLEGLVTEHYTDPSWGPGSYSVLPRAAPHLRQSLFALSQTGDDRATLASRCFDYIEGLRRQYGRPEDEPRHPAWTLAGPGHS